MRYPVGRCRPIVLVRHRGRQAQPDSRDAGAYRRGTRLQGQCDLHAHTKLRKVLSGIDWTGHLDRSILIIMVVTKHTESHPANGAAASRGYHCMSAERRAGCLWNHDVLSIPPADKAGFVGSKIRQPQECARRGSVSTQDAISYTANRETRWDGLCESGGIGYTLMQIRYDSRCFSVTGNCGDTIRRSARSWRQGAASGNCTIVGSTPASRITQRGFGLDNIAGASPHTRHATPGPSLPLGGFQGAILRSV